MPRPLTAALLLGLACRAPTADPGREAFRASLALRGVPPSAEEVRRIRDDPAALDAAIDRWRRDPRFAETMADWHAELLWLRHDTQRPFPAVGALRGVELGAIAEALGEAPLRHVAALVVADRPYTDLFTGRESAVDGALASIWGLPYDEAGPTWQLATRPPDAPGGGLLGDPTLLSRHISSDTNHHRARANLVHRAWLCEDLTARTLDLTGIDLADPEVVTAAVRDAPGCAGCHATLDPLAAAFVGHHRYILPGEVLDAEAGGCADPDFCYPLRLYAPDRVADREALGLPPPALDGRPVADLEGLGRALVDDPRFPRCVARQLGGYLGQQDPADLPDDEVERWAREFEASGWSLSELAGEIVRSPRFRAQAGEVGPLIARPEQVARTVQDRTGFVWRADPDRGSCPPVGCWGEVDVGRNARWGVRELGGGMDGYSSLHPVHAPQPMRHLAVGRLAEEAGAWVVAREAGLRPGERRLLREIELGDRDPDRVREQLARLHERVLASTPDRDELDATVALWRAVDGRSGSTERAWAAVIGAMLQSPELGLY